MHFGFWILKIGPLGAEIQKSIFSSCTPYLESRRIFGSQLLVDRFSKFKNLNALEFNSELISEANFVVKLNFWSKKCQKLREKSTVYKHSRCAKTGPNYISKIILVQLYTWANIFCLRLIRNFTIRRGAHIYLKIGLFWPKNGHFGTKTPCHQNIVWGT